MIYTLVNRYVLVGQCSINNSYFLREIFQRNGYPYNFIDRSFRLFLNRIHILKEKFPTVEKKPLRLVLPDLGSMLLQTRINYESPSKGYLTAVDYRLFLKVIINCVIIFTLKKTIKLEL